MPTVTIQKEQSHFTATTHDQCGQGQTVGEAIDALLQQGVTMPIYLRQLGGDEFFTQEQHDRVKELRQHIGALSAEEQAELETLLDAEFAAATDRLKAAFR
jgi:hypothetical protein